VLVNAVVLHITVQRVVIWRSVLHLVRTEDNVYVLDANVLQDCLEVTVLRLEIVWVWLMERPLSIFVVFVMATERCVWVVMENPTASTSTTTAVLLSSSLLHWDWDSTRTLNLFTINNVLSVHFAEILFNVLFWRCVWWKRNVLF
jgi:hypothetical protein